MAARQHSRKSRSFRPHIVGMEILEKLVMLDGSAPGDDPPVDMNPAVLPDPTDDFDSNNVSFVDLDAFTADANNLAMEYSNYAIPGGVDSQNGPEKDAVIAQLNAQRTDMLRTIDTQIAGLQKVKGTLTALATFTNELKTESQAELAALGNSVEELQQATLLRVSIGYQQAAITLLNNLALQTQGQISFLNNFKSKLNKAYDDAISSIKALNVSADSDNDYDPWYFSDQEAIV